MSFPGGMVDDLPVNRNAVVRFSNSLLANGAPAWQRYQAVRAVEAHRNLVLEKSQPDLADMVLLLAGLAKKERNIDIDAPPTPEEMQLLQGNINRREPTFIQTLRGEMRVLHYAYATEKAYMKWVNRFSSYVGSHDLEQLTSATFLLVWLSKDK